ncbi:hypothetical protein TI10_15130 [Photorhabdus luminescens subsp. luminescens]|nr:hypothetical protein TI10_15130 [Photorhabdus luminescens subsp. luminescens]
MKIEISIENDFIKKRVNITTELFIGYYDLILFVSQLSLALDFIIFNNQFNISIYIKTEL